jgi:hypothetical protein
MESGMQVPPKIKINISSAPVIALLGIYTQRSVSQDTMEPLV